MPYRTGSYGTVPMPSPQPIDMIGSLRDLANLATTGASLERERGIQQDETKARKSQEVLTAALTSAKGDLPEAITTLEGQGYFLEANTLRAKAGDIQAAQQKALAERLKATREGFATSTRYLQGVEAAATPDEQERLFAAVRPRLIEALPGLEQYVPPRLADNPNFLKEAIPFGLSATEVASRRSDALEALNDRWKQAKTAQERDDAIVRSMGPWIETADTGEEIGQIIDTAQKLYGASPAFAERFGEIGTGPLTPEVKQTILDRFGIGQEKAGGPELGSFADYVTRAATRMGKKPQDLTDADLRRLRKQYPGPQEAQPTSQAQVAAAERWKAAQVAALDKRFRDSTANDLNPMTQADYNAAQAAIEASFQRQLGGDAPPRAAAPGGPRVPGAPVTAPGPPPTGGPVPGGPASPGGVPPEVVQLLANEAPGQQFQLSDGTVWVKLQDGTIKQIQ